MAEKDVLGRAGEAVAARMLQGDGMQVLAQNWRCAAGEIDIVAVDGECIVAVEVKTRRTTRFGHPFDAIDARKRDRLWRLCHQWCAAHPELSSGRARRIDVVAVVGEPDRGASAPCSVEHWKDVR